MNFLKEAIFFIIVFLATNASTHKLYIPRTVNEGFCNIPFVYDNKVYHDCTVINGSDSCLQAKDKKIEKCKPRPVHFKSCQIKPPNVTVEEADEILSVHNSIRSQLPALRMRKILWNGELAMRAQIAAEKCLHQRTENSLCEERVVVGQNLVYIYDEKTFPSPMSWKEVIYNWMEEQQFYDWKNKTCIGDNVCHNYLQVVWDETSHVGCGKAYCTSELDGKMQKSIQYYCNYFLKENSNEGNVPYIMSKEKRCYDCYKFRPTKKFKCDKLNLCEACFRNNDDCFGKEDMDMLTNIGVDCSANSTCIDQRLCDAVKSGIRLPKTLIEFLKNTNQKKA